VFRFRFTHPSLYSWKMTHAYPMNRKLCRPASQSEYFREEENILSL